MSENTSSNAVDQAQQGQASVDAKQQPRTFSPEEVAQRATVSSKLNEDSGKYRKSPSER